jgi:hypothetical protein
MDEPSMNPFEPLIEAIAEAVVKKLASQNGHRESRESEDRLLDAAEAAEMLSVSAAPFPIFRLPVRSHTRYTHG